MNNRFQFTNNIRLRLVTVDDAGFVLSLRSDEAKSRHLSKSTTTLSAQREWLQSYKEREATGAEYYFVIEDNQGESLGLVRLYEFKGNSFCWGSWILKVGAPTYAALESALSVYEFAFNEQGFEKSHFDVRKANEKVVTFHTRFGAEKSGEDDLNYYFIFPREVYEKTKQRYSKFFKPSGVEERE